MVCVLITSIPFILWMPRISRSYLCNCCKQQGHERRSCQVAPMLPNPSTDELCSACTRLQDADKICVSLRQGGCNVWSKISAVLLVDSPSARSLWSALSLGIATTFPLFRLRYGIEKCNGIDYTKKLRQQRADHTENSMTSIERLCDSVALPNGRCPVGLCSFNAFYGSPVGIRDAVKALSIFNASWAEVSHFPFRSAPKPVRLTPLWIQEAGEEPQLLFCARHAACLKQQKPVLMPPPRLPDAECIVPNVTISGASLSPKIAIAGRKRYNSHSWNMLYMVRHFSNCDHFVFRTEMQRVFLQPQSAVADESADVTQREAKL